MFHFATLFDSNYANRGMALYQSLVQNCSSSFIFYILCLDNEVEQNFISYNNVKCISLVALEEKYVELIIAKQNRNKIEYYFTLSPYLPLYIIEKFPEIEQITTMDADLYFYNDPIIIFKTYPNASILITPHNFNKEIAYLSIYGEYNVSFQSFKNNKDGIECLLEWKRQCLDWCYDHYDHENERFADQKYLNNWHLNFKNVQSINMNGTGLAPWNINNYKYEIINNKIFINNQPLIYFHFHHLRVFNRYFALNGFSVYKAKITNKAIKLIYHTYLLALTKKNKNNDKTIGRSNFSRTQSFFGKILRTDGLWFFNSHFICWFNVYGSLIFLKKKLKF